MVAGSAWAAEPPSEDGPVPSSESIVTAIEDASELRDESLTDPTAAVGQPLEDLSREQAGELLTGVFGDVVEAPSGIYDDLQDARVLSTNVAVLPDGDAPKGPVDAEPEIESSGDMPRPTLGELSGSGLISSTIPLLVEDGDQAPVPVDLTLDDTGASLQPSAPLVDVRIPKELGDGIQLPDLGITVKLADAPQERDASIVEGNAAFYPNVAENSDFAVSPAPSGFETFSQLRDMDSPTTQVYRVTLPVGAVLVATKDGGAVVKVGDETLLAVQPPAAIDAAGEQVPVDLTVEGYSLSLHADPAPGAQYPILVDPLWQTYEWAAKGNDKGICSNSFQTEPFYACNNREEWGYDEIEYPWGGIRHLEASNGMNGVQHGIHVYARSQQRLGDHAAVIYTVPRYFKETPPPTSFIKTLKVSNVRWEALGPSASPYGYMGIWDYVNKGWIEFWSHTGQVEHGVNEPAFVYEFSNKQPNRNGKFAQIGIWATEASSNSNANIYAGAASVELGDTDVPQQPVPTIQSKWVNETAPPLQFSAGDTGLGVFAISASTEDLGTNGQPLYTWKAANGCIGVGDSACPQSWSSAQAKQPLTYDPKVLSTGIKYLKLVSEDPVGNKSSGSWEEVRIDHTPPQIALGGSITEQAALGARRNSYTLKAYGADGSTEYPQSGIAKAEVKVDGTTIPMEGAKLAEWSPSCTTRNCPLSAEWTLDSSSVAAGKHTVEVIATDAAGVSSAPQKVTIEIRPAAPPSLTLSGTMTEQATLGTSRPRYTLKAKSVASAAGIETPDLGAAPVYSSSIGSLGTGNGQFYAPADTAADSKGNLWVLDKGNNRLQKFNEKGEWVLTAGVGKLSSPSALALDASGNAWVADTGSNRVVEFKENGEFLKTFGTNVNKTKVEVGGTLAEKNLCTAASGNVCQAATSGSLAGQLKAPQGIAVSSTSMIWVVDSGNGRLEKFDMSGTYVSSLSSEGTEPGKLKEPKAMTISPDGSLWVADYGNDRIQRWSGSTFVAAIGKEGSGAGEFKGPAAIEADSTGNIWVGDQKNNRVEQFDRTGIYLNQFGSGGGGSGQFSFAASMGLTVDRLGSIWVTDPGHFKVQRWLIPGFPVYSSSIGGTSGTGNGQFSNVADVAADTKGNIWALDKESNRLQKFNEKGEWVLTTGAAGTGAGKLSSPSALALDGAANVWVADTANNRIVEFNEKGEFLETFGTNVNKTKVEASGSEAEKNLCTAASGNVCQAATAGSLAGQLKSPKGIALTPGGNIWIADTGNSRIEKFNPSGGLINNLSGEGTEPGKLKEPMSITVAPDGSIWVADTGNNRIEQWNSSLAFVRAVGKEGSAGGEFKAPAAIEADSSGNIWVGDQKNSRVEEFAEGGKYLGQFGAEGSGIFSFSAPMGIAIDPGGSIWVTEAGHFKVQKWVQETPRSEVTTTIWLDGAQKTSLRGGCKTSSCTTEPEWTLDASAYEVGSHTARVKSTDGLGRSSESTLNIQITKDSTKPNLEAAGTLFNAPEGWVEQDKYSINASATDGDYGVTSLALMIDGKQVASSSQSCTSGGCPLTLSQQVDMALYLGGSHPAELVATDGVGNKAARAWEVNVDPEGHISASEAEDTLEALESTSEGNPIGPSEEEPGVDGTAAGLGLTQAGQSLIPAGSEVPTQIPIAAANSMFMEILPSDAFDGPCDTAQAEEEETGESEVTPYFKCQVLETSVGENELTGLNITPLSIGEAAGNTTLVNGSAGVSTNSVSNVDTITRPLYDGALTFKALRDSSAPETFSWRVGLEEGQSMHSVDPQHVEVDYASGHEAFSITAEPAHDAVGTVVPSTLSVGPADVITLTVHHHDSQFVYPVLGGAGWQGGFTSVEIEGPKDEQELREEQERIEQEEQEAREALEAGAEAEAAVNYEGSVLHMRISVQGPPTYLGRTQEIKPNPVYSHPFKFNDCRYAPLVWETNGGTIPPERREGIRQTHCANSAGDRELLTAESVHGNFNVSPGVFVSVNDPVKCIKWGPDQPRKVDCGKKVTRWSDHGWREQIEVFGNYRFPPLKGAYFVGPTSACVTVRGTINRSPKVLRQPDTIFTPARAGTDEHPELQEPCNWP